jgi:hypothetical protein
VSKRRKNIACTKHVLTIVTLYTQFTIRPATCHRATARPAIDLGRINLVSDIESNTAQKPSRVGAAISKSIHYIQALSRPRSAWHFPHVLELAHVGRRFEHSLFLHMNMNFQQ